MARSKVAVMNRAQIKSLPEAGDALAEMAAAERALAKIEAEANARIDKAKADAALKTEPHKQRLKELSEGLQVYAEYNRAELFAKRQSVEMPFGYFGFRKSSELKPASKLTWAKVLEKLQSLKARRFIRVKEDVNRERLRELDADQLEQYGVRLVEKETFWIETKSEELGGDAA